MRIALFDIDGTLTATDEIDSICHPETAAAAEQA
jgi:hypothetical protein